jgi:hypothetical protein
VNGKTPVYLSLVLAAVLSAAMLLAQPYSYRSGPPSPWQAYSEPARRFLQAAMRKDSMALARQSAATAPVSWALGMARERPESLSDWASDVKVWTGSRHGDTTEILLYQPVWLRFVGTDSSTRVVEAGWAHSRETGIADMFGDDSQN